MNRLARLRSESVEERVGAFADLAVSDLPLPAEELSALLLSLGDARKAVQRRAAETCAALLERGADLRPQLEKLIEAPDWSIRWGAVFALSLAGETSPKALPTLLDALARNDGDLRWAAAERIVSLGKKEPPVVLPRLIGLMQTGSATQRKMALYCLRDLAAPGVELARAVESALASGDVEVRLAALSAYARLAPDRSTAARRIAQLLDDAEPRLQRAAAGVLGILRDRSPEVIEALQRAMSSGDPSLPRAAERALELIAEGVGG